MIQPLSLLIVADSPPKAARIVNTLQQGGFACDWERVATETEYRAALRPELDVILSAYTLADFDGLRALELLQEQHLDVPFILISSRHGEGWAVDAMKRGATDYLLQDQLNRLGAAVEQALELRKRRERQTHAAELETELEELKNTFVALVSHELRTPVTLTVGYFQMALELLDDKAPPETRDYMQRALANAEQVSRIVQELTDFARIQGKTPMKLTNPISLREAFVQVFSLFKPQIETKQLKAALNMPREILALPYDGESIVVILRNLLSNAVKFSRPGERISVTGSFSAEADQVILCVNDAAPPIPAEKQPLIFDDFRQVENHLTRRYEGMGLGLAVARRTARLFGGDITLTVRPDGNTFTVRLPRKPLQPE